MSSPLVVFPSKHARNAGTQHSCHTRSQVPGLVGEAAISTLCGTALRRRPLDRLSPEDSTDPQCQFMIESSLAYSALPPCRNKGMVLCKSSLLQTRLFQQQVPELGVVCFHSLPEGDDKVGSHNVVELIVSTQTLQQEGWVKHVQMPLDHTPCLGVHERCCNTGRLW